MNPGRPSQKIPIQVSDTVFVPISAQLDYFQAEAGSNALPNSFFGLYRQSPRRPTRVLNLVTDFHGNSLPYCADGTTLPSYKIGRPVWAVYYAIPDRLSIIPLLWYFNSVLKQFRYKREVILIYGLADMEMFYSTRSGLIQSNIEMFFDDTPLAFKKSVLRSQGKSGEWWE